MQTEINRFQDLLRQGSAELHEDNAAKMSSGELCKTPNVIDPDDVALFWIGMDKGLIKVGRGGRFNTADRPLPNGHWGLLSRSQNGGWYNAEYLPQIAAYVDAIVNLGYPQERVLFELPGQALQLDLAILDDDAKVVVLGEAKRSVPMLNKLRADVLQRFTAGAPGPETAKRGDEARQLSWRLWTVNARYLWLIGPGVRDAFHCQLAPLRLDPLQGLPTAESIGLSHRPPHPLGIPELG